MRRYLKEFLSDRRVIETPRLLWWPILNLDHPVGAADGEGASDYASIWNKERDESPLRTITRAQSEKLEAWIGQGGLGASGHSARRSLSNGACATAIPRSSKASTRWSRRAATDFLLVPLYPQYAAATSATVCDKAFEALADDAVPADHAGRASLPSQSPAYIDAHGAQSLRAGDRQARRSSPRCCSPRSTACAAGIRRSRATPIRRQCIETWQRATPRDGH